MGKRIAIVEDAGFLDRVLKVRKDLPLLERIYVIEPAEGSEIAGLAEIEKAYVDLLYALSE